MTVPTVPVDAGEAARREAEIRALEAAVIAAAVGQVADRTAAVGDRLRQGAGLAVAAPAVWALMRRRAAVELRAIRPQVAARVERMLPRAARLGAKHAGGPLPDGHDPAADALVARILGTVDQLVKDRLARAADTLTDGPVDTPSQVEAAVRRVDSARRVAETAAGDATARAVAGGAAAAADALGISLVWVAERDACVNCLRLHGAVREPGGRFRAAGVVAVWPDALVEGPSLHPACRCSLAPASPAVADLIARTVARGRASRLFAPAELRARFALVDQLLRSGRVRVPAVRSRTARGRTRR